jgi:prepilin-type N-terminal cleavage/methylation domain-containing protein
LKNPGFSLVEVILSLGILSVALLIVFAVLTPFLSQTGDVVEITTINRITDRISAEVEQLSFSELISILDQETALFASKEGDRLTLANDPEIDTLLPEIDRHYGVTLKRNLDLSPSGKDATSGYLAFQVKIERIIHAPDGTPIDSPLNHTLAVFNKALTRKQQ